MASDASSESKQTLRLFKLLSSSGSNRSEVTILENELALVQREKKHHFSLSLVRNCQREGWVSLKGKTLILNAEGLAHLKRALHPDIPFRAQNTDLIQKDIMFEGASKTVLANQAESPLLRLFTRKEKTGKAWLDENQFKAGEKLRADFEKANLQPRISANWEASVSSGNRGSTVNDLSDFALDARMRVECALNEIGPELAEVVLDVCCFLKGLETVERERRWPPRSAKLLLRTALSALSRHYGFSTQGTHARMSKQIRTWTTPDYRPALNGR